MCTASCYLTRKKCLSYIFIHMECWLNCLQTFCRSKWEFWWERMPFQLVTMMLIISVLSRYHSIDLGGVIASNLKMLKVAKRCPRICFGEPKISLLLFPWQAWLVALAIREIIGLRRLMMLLELFSDWSLLQWHVESRF